MIGAVVFDCDGVLVDSERVNNEVLAELVTCAGLPTTAEDSAARYMGRSTAECLAEIEHQLGRRLDFDLAAEYEREGGVRRRTGAAGLGTGRRGHPVRPAHRASPGPARARPDRLLLDREGEPVGLHAGI
jgi:phosphoglycolate phosphatase-like HAD superfamily hydrolase